MSSNATLGVETRSRKRKRWHDAHVGEAIPGLLNDIVITHVLRSEHFDDPADLARLPAVSRAMRDAVAATGLRFKELGEANTIELGCLRALQRLQRGGRLSRQERLCQAAARSGQLEELKALRADGCPWNNWTCLGAARGGHLEVLQLARVNGCVWDKYTCLEVAWGGHLQVLQWAHENDCPWDAETCEFAASGGHLGILKWLRANGCPWDRETIIRARAIGHFEMANWARANGCPEQK
jgi:hypothetical protein